MNAQEPVRKSRGRPETNGITTLRTAVNRLGSRVIDRRTALGKALARWRAELVQDLGGPEALSVQQQAIIDPCVRMQCRRGAS